MKKVPGSADLEWARRTVANQDYLPWADVRRAKEILGLPEEGLSPEEQAAYDRVVGAGKPGAVQR